MSPPGEREHLDRVRERFTRTASVFSDFVLTSRRAEAEFLMRMAEPQGHERALDLACGPGTLARSFAPRVRWMCGLDLTSALLEQARRAIAAENLSNLVLACGNAMALPFADGSFDLAVCGYSLHHIADPAAVIREFARVVRRSGRVALLDLVVPDDTAKAEANNAIERARDPSHARTLSAAEIERLLVSVGFRPRVREVEEHPRSFDDWIRVAGWKRGDPAYEETRRLMEASIPRDAAWFHPRLLPGSAGEGADIEMVQTVLYVVAERD